MSHDRYFREKITTAMLEIKDARISRQWGEHPIAETGNDLLALKTERQAVLGKLSFAKVGSEKYKELDTRFLQLIREINILKK